MDENVIYIGQSINIRSRISSHKHILNFNNEIAIHYFICEQKHLNNFEWDLIRKFKPMLNHSKKDNKKNIGEEFYYEELTKGKEDRIHLRINRNLKNIITQICANHGLSYSEFIIELIIRYIRENTSFIKAEQHKHDEPFKEPEPQILEPDWDKTDLPCRKH